jgi:inhibitor of KinA
MEEVNKQMNASIFQLGEQAVSFEFNGDTVDSMRHEILMRMKDWIEQNPFDGLLDIIPSYRSISVRFDAFKLLSAGHKKASTFVESFLRMAYDYALKNPGTRTSRMINVPVCYDSKFGPDIDFICEQNHLSREHLIHLHTSTTYNVYAIGFLPGFPYLGFVEHQLEVPRKSKPRSLVPAGSVGIAGKQTGIYPLNSPGGWQIIGRTPLKLFNSFNQPPVLIETGDRVSFYQVDEAHFDEIQKTQV